MSNEDCTTAVRHSIIKLEENRSKVLFRNENNEEYEISRIDGCLVTQGIRADYMISKGKRADRSSVIVELKGVDVAHACDQVLQTAESAAVKPLIGKRLGFLIVCVRYPRFDTFVARAKQKAARRYRAGFHVVSGQRSFDIRRVVDIDGPD